MSKESLKELSAAELEELQQAKKLFNQKKYSEAIDTLIKYGPYDDEAAIFVADIYLFGHGNYEIDYQKANYWLQLAANMNNARALHNLAVSYELGTGVEKDESKAFQLYNKALANGHTFTHNALGNMYLRGKGTAIDESKAFYHFEQGSLYNVNALYNLAHCYEDGTGTDCNLEKALDLFKKAASLGLSNASDDISRLQHKLDRQHALDDILNRILPTYSRYHLDNRSEKCLARFFRFLTQTDNTNFSLSNNFMVHCNDPERAYAFIEHFSKNIQEVLDYAREQSHSAKEETTASPAFTSHFLTEDKFLNSQALNDIMSCDVFALYDCKSTPLWDDAFTDHFIYECEHNPSTFKIIAASENVIRSKFKENSHLYYRVFRNHIYIGEMTSIEVYQAILDRLYNKNVSYSVGFSNALLEYINTVYPKADLKNNKFICDLLERILTSYYGCEELPDILTSKHIPYYRKTKSFDEAIKAFDNLTGLKSVKEVFSEIQYMIQESGASAIPSLHMAFVGNPGTGKTTVAQMTADLFYSMGVIRSDKVISVSALNLIGKYVGWTSKQTQSYCEKAYDGILFIDEAYLLTPSNDNSSSDQFRQECIGTLIQEMENNRDRLIVIFAGYPKEMDNFLHNSNSGFASRLYKVVQFDDYSDDELVEIFENLCKKEGFSLSCRARENVRLKLLTQRYSRDFGNARTVRNAFIDAKKNYRQEYGNSGDHILQERHIVLETTLRDYQSVSDELNAMIGLKNAKSEINRAIATCRFSKESNLDFPISKHMLFLGNAGTGKSTVASLFCQMLFSIGAAKSPNCISIATGDLVGSRNPIDALHEYCRKAFGGVLFIDEAYELPSYCIPVLLDIMETQRDDIIIILAGYCQEMDFFLNQNQGLKSRFPVSVYFDDYSIDELSEIFESFCNKYNLSLTDVAKKDFRYIIEKEKNLQNFGNARTVRNIFEQTYRKHAENFFNHPIEEKRYVIDSQDLFNPS